MPIPTIQLTAIPEFNNIHEYFEHSQDFQKFLGKLPADRYPASELKRLRLIPQLEAWLEMNEPGRQTFFGITFMHPVGPSQGWRRAELFKCLAIEMADGHIHGFKSRMMTFEKG